MGILDGGKLKVPPPNTVKLCSHCARAPNRLDRINEQINKSNSPGTESNRDHIETPCTFVPFYSGPVSKFSWNWRAAETTQKLHAQTNACCLIFQHESSQTKWFTIILPTFYSEGFSSSNCYIIETLCILLFFGVFTYCPPGRLQLNTPLQKSRNRLHFSCFFGWCKMKSPKVNRIFWAFFRLADFVKNSACRSG